MKLNVYFLGILYICHLDNGREGGGLQLLIWSTQPLVALNVIYDMRVLNLGDTYCGLHLVVCILSVVGFMYHLSVCSCTVNPYVSTIVIVINIKICYTVAGRWKSMTKYPKQRLCQFLPLFFKLYI